MIVIKLKAKAPSFQTKVNYYINKVKTVNK